MLFLSMIKMFCLFSFSMSLIMMAFSKHPLTIGFLVVLQALNIAILLTSLSFFSWFSYIIFMIYLGGILMIFSYIISITFSMEKLYSHIPKLLIFLTYTVVITMFYSKQSLMNLSNYTMKKSLFSCYSYSYKSSLLFLSLLLMIMILVVLITDSSKNSMRSH